MRSAVLNTNNPLRTRPKHVKLSPCPIKIKPQLKTNSLDANLAHHDVLQQNTEKSNTNFPFQMHFLQSLGLACLELQALIALSPRLPVSSLLYYCPIQFQVPEPIPIHILLKPNIRLGTNLLQKKKLPNF